MWYPRGSVRWWQKRQRKKHEKTWRRSLAGRPRKSVCNLCRRGNGNWCKTRDKTTSTFLKNCWVYCLVIRFDSVQLLVTEIIGWCRNCRRHGLISRECIAVVVFSENIASLYLVVCVCVWVCACKACLGIKN